MFFIYRSGFQLPNLRPVNVNIYGGAGDTPTKSENSPVGFDVTSPGRPHSSNTSLKSELSDAVSPEKISNRLSKSIEVECKTQTTEKSQVTDAIDVRESGTATSKMLFLFCFVWFLNVYGSVKCCANGFVGVVGTYCCFPCYTFVGDITAL